MNSKPPYTAVHGSYCLTNKLTLESYTASDLICLPEQRLQPVTIVFAPESDVYLFPKNYDLATVTNHLDNGPSDIYPIKVFRPGHNLITQRVPIRLALTHFNDCHHVEVVTQKSADEVLGTEYSALDGVVLPLRSQTLVLCSPTFVFPATFLRYQAHVAAGLSAENHRTCGADLATAPFDVAHPGHMALLDRIHRAVFGKPAPGPVDNVWLDLGFQRPDPTSDFRGAGVLGLLQLVIAVERHPCVVEMIHQHMESFEKSVPVPLCAIDIAHRLRDWSALPQRVFHTLADEMVKSQIVPSDIGRELDARLLHLPPNAVTEELLPTGLEPVIIRPLILDSVLDWGGRVVANIVRRFSAQGASIHEYNAVVQEVVKGEGLG